MTLQIIITKVIKDVVVKEEKTVFIPDYLPKEDIKLLGANVLEELLTKLEEK